MSNGVAIPTDTYKLGFIGAGKMAESIAYGVVKFGVLPPISAATAAPPLRPSASLSSITSKQVIWIWTHGFGKEAVKLFEDIRKGTTEPNDVTFLCIVSACSHSGYEEKGHQYFTVMKEEYGLEPSTDHFGAIFDLLGRGGQLEEAWNFVETCPLNQESYVLPAMLGACKIHKNIYLAEKAVDRLFELDPDDGGYHVLFANIYATASKWAKVRTMMEKKRIRKTPGCS